jgi:hypothetical protein
VFYLVGVNNKSNPTSFIVSDGFTFDALTLNGNYDTTINVKEPQPSENFSATIIVENRTSSVKTISQVSLNYTNGTAIIDNFELTIQPGSSNYGNVEIPAKYYNYTIQSIEIDGMLLAHNKWSTNHNGSLIDGSVLNITLS